MKINLGLHVLIARNRANVGTMLGPIFARKLCIFGDWLLARNDTRNINSQYFIGMKSCFFLFFL